MSGGRGVGVMGDIRCLNDSRKLKGGGGREWPWWRGGREATTQWEECAGGGDVGPARWAEGGMPRQWQGWEMVSRCAYPVRMARKEGSCEKQSISAELEKAIPYGGEMGAWLMNCKMDKQLCAFESAAGSSAQTLALSAGKSHGETARNSLERRTICDANPESSSSLEASSKELGVVTG